MRFLALMSKLYISLQESIQFMTLYFSESCYLGRMVFGIFGVMALICEIAQNIIVDLEVGRK